MVQRKRAPVKVKKTKEGNLLPHEREEVLHRVIELYVLGYSNTEVIGYLQPDFPDKKPEDFELVFRQAYNIIRDKTLVDIDKIIPQHVELYEKIYQQYEKLNYIPGKLKVMRRKEALVGLHKESNYVEINNEMNVVIEIEEQYDPTKLNTKEQKRLSELMKRVVRR